jgi:cell division protein FtsW
MGIFDINKSRGIYIPVLALVAIGIVMVYSSTALMSTKEFGSSFHYLKNHIFTVSLGLAAMFLLSQINYLKLRLLAITLLILGLILLVLVFVPGIGLSANGARRWLRLWPTTFQPSEFVKLALVIFLADYMTKYSHKMRDFRFGILIPAGIMLFFQGIIIIQPDFGAVMSLGILTMGMIFLGGARLKHIGACILCALPVVVFLLISKPYRVKRVTAFLDPWADPLGSGFQLVQSFIAFGSGSIFGVGIGGSKQKLFFLPEVHTDFIFSLIGEELGLIGVLIVVSLFLWLFVRGIWVARKASDTFSHYLAFGLTMMIGCQALINFAVTTGLMPTKGLPLPFISYGGSAQLINMAAMGILISIAKRNEEERFEQFHRPLFVAGESRERPVNRRLRESLFKEEI